MLNMVIRKARHEKVAVIIVRLVADIDTLDAGIFGGFFEVLGQQLTLFVEIVAGALSWLTKGHIGRVGGETYHVNQRIQTSTPLLQQLGCIMLLPLSLLVPEIPPKRLLTPLAVNRVRDRRKGRNGLVFAGVTKELPILQQNGHAPDIIN